MKHLLLFLLFVCTFVNVNAQLQIEAANTPEEIENALEFLFGIGVDISNVEIYCAEDGFGTFESDLMDTQKGLILSSGYVQNALNPTQGIQSGVQNEPEVEADFFALDAVAAEHGIDLTDYCYITFDIVSVGDQFLFSYSFASEEYPNYVCTVFNDFMGIFISPTDNLEDCEQISLVPGTSLPVAIGSINGGRGEEGQYCNNNSFGYNCPCNEIYYIPNYDEDDYLYNHICYGGLTRELDAVAYVEPYETYTIKMGVADAGDQIFDSAFFVEHGSFYSEGFIDEFKLPVQFEDGEQPIISSNDFLPILIDISIMPPNGGIIELTFEGSAIEGEHFDVSNKILELQPNGNDPYFVIYPIEENIGSEVLDLTIKVSKLITPNNEFTLDKSIEIFIDGTATSINIVNDFVQLYPNPASDVLTISLDKPIDNATHKIYDVKGQEVLSQNNDGNYTTININHLDNGVYWYELVSENGVIERKKLLVIK